MDPRAGERVGEFAGRSDETVLGCTGSRTESAGGRARTEGAEGEGERGGRRARKQLCFRRTRVFIFARHGNLFDTFSLR